ncbi:MAG: hypothetical protein ACJ789_14355 [Thermomicrobiales bacterium]
MAAPNGDTPTSAPGVGQTPHSAIAHGVDRVRGVDLDGWARDVAEGKGKRAGARAEIGPDAAAFLVRFRG